MESDTIPFAVCRRCNGLWFSRETIESSDPTPAAIPDASRRTRKFSRISRRPRNCPICAIDLSRETIDGVEIDRCANCGGVWLDPGEYEAARQRLRNPGAMPAKSANPRFGDDAARATFDGLVEVLLWLART
jgi:Zn-finger nucleic acid-binding protein